MILKTVLAALLLVVVASSHAAQTEHYWVFQTSASTKYVHMSTIDRFPNGTLVAAFQASSLTEGCNDQSIFIKWSYDGGRNWTPHRVAQKGEYAVWGPVLRYRQDLGELWMFFSKSTPYQYRNSTSCGSFGKSYPGGEVYMSRSRDGGITWQNASLLLGFKQHGQIAKVSANPPIQTRTGRWILPVWQEAHTSNDTGLSCATSLISDDDGQTWAPHSELHNNTTWLIENTLAQLPDSTIVQLFRTQTGSIYQSESTDDGNTWSTPAAIRLKNPNSKVCLAYRLYNNASAMLAYNPSSSERRPLYLAETTAPVNWTDVADLDSGSNSYHYPTPCVHDSTVYTTYSASTTDGIKLAVTTLD